MIAAGEPGRRILYTGCFRFPEGDAAAARVLGIGRALRDAGFEVVFAGGESEGRPAEAVIGGGFRFDGFPYFPQAELDGGGRSPLARLARYFSTGRRTAGWLGEQLASRDRPAAVILYNGLAGYHLRVGALCRRFRVPLLVDLTEWYAPQQCVGGRFGIHWWDVEYTMRRLVARADAVLPISRFLAEEYRRRGRPVLRVPPLVDLEAPRWRVPARSAEPRVGLDLVYAGNPGRKDALSTILGGLARRPTDRPPVRLRILGMTAEALRAYCTVNGLDHRRVVATTEAAGRVPQATVPAELARADYGILLRPDARYSRAGFPTKVVEYLAAGTAVIVTPTGDLGEYVRDGQEGWWVAGNTEEAFLEGLDRALEAGRDRARELGAAARRRAAACFDYRRFIQPLGRFVADVIAGRPPAGESPGAPAT